MQVARPQPQAACVTMAESGVGAACGSPGKAQLDLTVCSVHAVSQGCAGTS